MEIHNLQSKISNPSNYIIDIGASSGVESDPVYTFIVNPNYKGLCIDGNKDKIVELKKKTHFDIYDGYITPINAIDIFKKYNVPINIDILKIDIDGYDLAVLREILSIYKPSIIIAEINEKIPPPILFEVNYSDKYSWDESHLYGFSIQSADSVIGSFGYKITQIYELYNIICINYNLCDKEGIDRKTDIFQLYKNEYILNPLKNDLWWNDDIQYWLEIHDIDELCFEINRYFSCVNTRSKFDKKTKICGVDYTLSIAEDKA